MLVTFENVTITLSAESPKAAYDLLCSHLERLPDFGYMTDTFFVNEVASDDFDTSELWTCTGCGRPEAECSADPCPGVMEDRDELDVPVVAPAVIDHDIAAWEGEGGRAL